jgi:hypothetical protein
MTTSDWILTLNGSAIVLAPIVALWIGGILQRRSDAHQSKLTVFSTLISLRHAPLSGDLIRALNSIDAVFADDPSVRQAWTEYFTALNDPNLNTSIGASIREQKRRDLLLEIVKALKLTQKISSADLLRTYLPTFVAEDTQIAMLERLQKRAVLEEDLKHRGINYPQFVPQLQVNPAPSPVPQPGAPSSAAGNGAEQPQTVP